MFKPGTRVRPNPVEWTKDGFVDWMINYRNVVASDAIRVYDNGELEVVGKRNNSPDDEHLTIRFTTLPYEGTFYVEAKDLEVVMCVKQLNDVVGM